MGTIFMWLKKSQSPKIFVAVPQASHFLTFNHLFAIIFSSAKDVVYINYTGRILRKRPAFWSPLPLYLSFLYDPESNILIISRIKNFVSCNKIKYFDYFQNQKFYSYKKNKYFDYFKNQIFRLFQESNILIISRIK